MTAADRIFFPGNPWPKGHRLKALTWTGRIEPERGLWFDLGLESEKYAAEDGPAKRPAEDEEESDWRSKIVWKNYGGCLIRSVDGFKVATKRRPLAFRSLAKAPFRVDVSRKGDALGSDGPRAFDIYLLGHDAVANHSLHFTRRRGPAAYTLAWDGRIALTYAGSTNLAHRFSVKAARVEFEGFTAPKGTSPQDAHAMLAPFVTDPAAWTPVSRADRIVVQRATP